MANSLNNNFNRPLRDEVIPLSVQSADTRGYFFSNKKFNEVINLCDEFVA